MSYVGKVVAGGSTHLVGSTLYGTCGTAAGTAAKVVTLSDFDKLDTGVTIHVKFTYSNTVASPSLNVNSTGAKAIMRYGTTRPSTSAATSWNAGAVISFTYDGSYWQMNDFLNNTYSVPTSYTSTPAAVSTAGAAGSATTWAKGDHVHAITATTISSALGFMPLNYTVVTSGLS